ncbi:MAG: type IV pilin [Halobacteriaceae archaeon]
MTRAVSTALSTTVLALLTVVLAAVLGAGTAGIATDAADGGTTTVALSATATADGTVRLVNRGGTALDTRTLRVRVLVDGERLDHQPPVPFFAAEGFHGGPTGAFNPAADPTWEVGESASFRVADTNHPTLAPGRTVTVRVYREGTPVGTAEATVRKG